MARHHNLASAGVIIASSILVARALAPAELAIANWKGFVQARQSWARLSELFARLPAAEQPHALPAPSQSLVAENVTLAPPGTQRIVVQDVSLSLQRDRARNHRPERVGQVQPRPRHRRRLASRSRQGQDRRRGHRPMVQRRSRTAYRLPAPGSGAVRGHHRREHRPVRSHAQSGAVIAAAKSAGIHEMILRLTEGYDTRIGEGGAGLSAGQRQRVGLARRFMATPSSWCWMNPTRISTGRARTP